MEWTGNGVADGTAVSSANVNTSGNGDTMSCAFSGTGAMIYAGDGFDAWGDSGSIYRLDTAVMSTSKVLVAQLSYTPKQTPTGSPDTIIVSRSASANAAMVGHYLTGAIGYRNAGGVDQNTGGGAYSPALVVGHKYVIDVIVALSQTAAASSSNGRVILRVRDMTDSSWNSGAAWYYDTGYTANVGTVDLDRLRFGHIAGVIASGTPNRFERLKWDRITADMTNVTGQSNVAPYFMSDPPTGTNQSPTASIDSGTPSLAVQNTTVPLRATIADADGTVTGQWSIIGWPSSMSGPPVLSNPTSMTNASFTAVGLGDYVVRLTATDNANATTSVTKTITVNKEVTAPPTELVWTGTVWK